VSVTAVAAPGLDVSGDGHGCNTLTGQFDVTEVSFASTGELLAFVTAPVLNLPEDMTVLTVPV
jgi:hypothetical protein